MADSDVDINISGDSTGAQKAFKDAADAAQASVGKINGAFEGVGKVFETLMGHFAAITAVLAGGAVFKESIDAAKEFTGQVTNLSKQLGISAEEASGLNVALETIGSSSDSYTDALSKLTRQVRTNEAGLNEMGIATRDSNGHFLDGRALMDSAITALKGYKEGTDRNLEAQVAFGKGAQEAAALLKLSNEVQDAGAKKARELNLVLGPENQAAVKAYKLGMAETREVLLAVENTIGQAMMPVLATLAQWFSESGPAAVSIFKPIMLGIADVLKIVVETVMELWDIFASAFKGILQLVAFALTGDGSISSFGSVCTFVFDAVKGTLLSLELVFTVVFGTIGLAIQLASATLRRFATTAEAALRGDFKGASAAWKAGTAEIERILDESGARMVASAKRINDKLNALLDGPAKGSYRASDNYGDAMPKGKSYNGPKEKSSKDGPTLMAQFDAELAQQKQAIDAKNVLDNTFYSMSKAAEAAFWQAKLATVDSKSKEYYQIQKKSIDAQLASSKEGFDATLADLERQEAAIKYDYDAKLKVAEQEVALLRQKYGEKSKEVEKGEEAIQKLRQAKTEQDIQLQNQFTENARNAAIARIDLEEQQAQNSVALMQTTEAQLLADQVGFENRRTAIATAALQERLVLATKENNQLEQAKIYGQLEALKAQHESRMLAIAQKSAMDQSQLSRDLFGNLQSGFSTVITNAMKGSFDLKTTLTSVYGSIADSLAKAVTKMVSDWITGELLKKEATVATSLAQIQASAAKAAGEAYAAIAGIPLVGPFLAPAAAAVAYTGVLAFGALTSAEGGYDIPRSINPVVQTHGGEMILPKELADRIRSVTPSDDNSRGGGGGDTIIHNHYNGPVTPRDHERWIAQHLPGATQIATRGFNMPKPA